ncbi:GntR family transcriptional regulator [Nesterenkonia ebinurensis]|uniref:GntR family transcriptional regulator n=1 Tax=Nesterenkonia ebinurensis TaxID=2608252 RepID=UPI00123DCF2F|nr:GntR family transcriptional regulator [Nesterenkonia ebinurensis]
MAGELEIDIDRSSPVPLYHQVAQAFEQAIREGALAPETKLDNEIDLAKRYHVSRPTLRQAMDKLVRDGLVVRRRGVGTQVIGPRVRRSLKLSSLYNDLQESGAQPRTSVLTLETVTAEDEVRDRLGLAPGTEVYHLRRLRSIDGQCLGIMENYLPLSVGTLTGAALERDGLYNVMRRQGSDFQMAHQTVGATVATAAQADLLGISPGSPLVTVQRTALDSAGTAIEFGDHVYRADLYSYETTLMNH